MKDLRIRKHVPQVQRVQILPHPVNARCTQAVFATGLAAGEAGVIVDEVMAQLPTQ
jgi:hypothetical protein